MKKMKIPRPRTKSIIPNPTTNAVMITDLRLTRWKSSHEKKRVEREKTAIPIPQTTVTNLFIKSWSRQKTGQVKSTEEMSHSKNGGEKSHRIAPFRTIRPRDKTYNKSILRTEWFSLRDYNMMLSNEACSARTYGERNQNMEMGKMRIGTERKIRDLTRES